MHIESLLLFLLVGAVAGWLAGLIMKGKKSGILINMLVGIAGAFIGGFTFSLLGISAHGLLGSLVTAVVGAVILLFILKKIR